MLLLVLSLFASPSYASDPLINWSEQILTHVKGPEWSNASCVSYLQDVQKRVDQLDESGLTRDRLRVAATPLIDNLWSIRKALHARLPKVDNSCATEMRNLFRQFRFLEDFLGEIRANPENLDASKIKFADQPVPIDESAPFYLLQADKKFVLQPGDVMLARGVSFLSAMISRLSDVDSQFSHVILVTENPETKAIETIESYVGTGVAIYDRKTALRNENARLLVLRPKDRELGRRAARQMRELVMSRQGANKILYDYALDFQDHSTMSCAESTQYAFILGSANQFNFPERPSNLTRGLDLLTHLGVKAGPTFAPGDLENDSRFEMIAEWRDLRLTEDSRLRDAIMTQMLQWMDHDGFVLHETIKSRVASGPLWEARRTRWWPLIQKYLHLNDFSPEIPSNMVGTVELLGELGEGVLAQLKIANDAYNTRTGLPMSYLQLYKELENIRSRDEITYANSKTRKNSVLIKYLRKKS